MNTTPQATPPALALLGALATLAIHPATAAPDAAPAPANWTLGAPVVAYWAGPPMTDATARQMADGGWNLVWCTREAELDVARRHGLRALLQDGLINPASLDDPQRRGQLDALVDRVRSHAALYAYHLTDEPNAAQFPALGRLVAYLRERDPAHLAYINLFPTYATNEQLGTSGDVTTAYQEYLRRYVAEVKPALVSYDHYQFALHGDRDQYFLNLKLVRQTAMDAGVPFLNIVQACTWAPETMRVPNPDELRYLVYTTLAYGAQAISYYVYSHPGHHGSIAGPDGTPGPLYHALMSYNREFAAIAGELQPLRPLAAWHTALREPGCEPPPAGAAFRLAPGPAPTSPRGFLLGLFGAPAAPSHAVVVNLDYTAPASPRLTGPGPLQVFDARTGRWAPAGPAETALDLPPGGGALVRVGR